MQKELAPESPTSKIVTITGQPLIEELTKNLEGKTFRSIKEFAEYLYRMGYWRVRVLGNSPETSREIEELNRALNALPISFQAKFRVNYLKSDDNETENPELALGITFNALETTFD